MEFDSGGNDVRIRTGKTLGLGKAPLIGVRRDSNVSSDKNLKTKFFSSNKQASLLRKKIDPLLILV